MTRIAVYARYPAKAWAIAFAFLLLADTAIAKEEAGFISLILKSVSAERKAVPMAGRQTAPMPIWRYVDEVTFTCNLQVDNGTGADLVVQSSVSYTPFADLELVVTDLNGKVLSQQPHSYHLSVTLKGRTPVGLKRGETTTELRFPIDSIDSKLKTVKVRLVGTFPGSAYKRICSSDTVEVSIENSKEEKIELPPQPSFPYW